MSYSRQDVLFKIKKLYELSKSSNENEAVLAATKARELLAKYNLSMADLPADQIEHAIDVVERSVDAGRALRNWVKALIVHVCRNFACQHVIRRQRGAPPLLTFIGIRADCEVAAYTFAFLYRELNALADERTPRLKEENPGWNGTALRYAYLEGAVQRVGERLKEETEKCRLAEQAACSALVLAKDHLVAEYMARTFQCLKKESSRGRVLSAWAFTQGYCDAEGLELRPALAEESDAVPAIPSFP